MATGTALAECDAPVELAEERSAEPESDRIQLRGTWKGYLALTDLIDPRVRTAYSGGEIEIMTLSLEHEAWTALLGRLLEALTEELDLPCQSGGGTTFRRQDLESGLEPDRCYYLENEGRVRNKLRIDLSVDPPPDLAMEVEITCSAELRMGIYAALGVPEVWRFDGTILSFHLRTTDGTYAAADCSRHFPFLSVSALAGFLKRRGEVSETALVKSYREWVRRQIARNWPQEDG